MGEALPFLFKRLPLWTTEANDLDYKCTYPFTACLEKEFMSWNIGKRLAAEVSRYTLVAHGDNMYYVIAAKHVCD